MTTQDLWRKLAPAVPTLRAGKRWHVFISYRSVNRPWAINLYDVLREHGFEVFIAPCVVKPGQRLASSLENALEQSASAVLVWSTAARDSEWCRDEYETMLQLSKEGGFHFVPIVLDETPPPGFARSRVYLNFADYPDGPNGGELLRLLFGLANEALTPRAARFATAQDEQARRASAAIAAAIKSGDSQRLVGLARANKLAWKTSSALGCKVAEGLTKLAKYDEAIALAEKLHVEFPRAIRPRQLEALALARRGKGQDLRAAQQILGQLYELGERDPETLGIYARTWMDRFEKTKDPVHLRSSRDYYLAAFDAAPDDYYTGINAAAKSVFLGGGRALAKAHEIAGRVQKIVGKSAVQNDYWKSATVAEVRLIRREFKAAGRLYQSAVAMAPAEVGSHASTWKQAQRLMEHLRPNAVERGYIARAFAHLA